MVFEAKNGDKDDYHKNMNAEVFSEYFEGLCKWMQATYPGRKVVFHMDNAGYHKKIDGGNVKLWRATKMEIIKWLREQNVPKDLLYKPGSYKYKNKDILYKLTRLLQYSGEIATEKTATDYGYRVLWIPPYHPMLNPIKEAWGVGKGFVARKNDGSNMGKV